jgi:hypothetical protein
MSSPGKVYQFMSEHRNEYTTREKDVSFQGQLRRLLQMDEEGGGVRLAEGSRRGIGGPDPPDTRTASLPVREPPCEGNSAPGLQEAGKPQGGCPVDAGKRTERPGKAEVHPNNRLKLRVPGLRQRVEP